MMAKIKTSRADQIPNILDKHDIQGRQIKMMQGIMDHVCVQMTGRAGGDLNGRHTFVANTIRIVLSGYTDLDSVTDAMNQGVIDKFLTKPWDHCGLKPDCKDWWTGWKRLC